MNLYKLLVSAVYSIIITYILTIMYIGNKLIFKVLDNRVVYSPIQLQQSQILPGFYFIFEENQNTTSIPYYYRNISIPMKISFLLLSL